jgi:hypothetical protein
MAWAAITCANGDRVETVCSVVRRENASIDAGTDRRVPTKLESTMLRDCLFMAMEKTSLELSNGCSNCRHSSTIVQVHGLRAGTCISSGQLYSTNRCLQAVLPTTGARGQSANGCRNSVVINACMQPSREYPLRRYRFHNEKPKSCPCATLGTGNAAAQSLCYILCG